MRRSIRFAAAGTTAAVGLSLLALAAPAQAERTERASDRANPLGLRSDFDPNAFDAQGAERARSWASVQAGMDEMIDDGAVGAVARIDTPKGAREWSAGDRRMWSSLPANPEGAFRVASNTKMMVATLVMQQVDKGTWSLDTTVEEIAPGLLPGHGEVTLEQLLSHTSGMPEGVLHLLYTKMADPNSFPDFIEVLGESYEPEQVIAAALQEEWQFEPGTGFFYSNAGYVVLGTLLERATGQPLAVQLRRNIFAPAGMTRSAFPSEPGLRLGSNFEAAKTPVPDRWWGLPDWDPDLFWAAGATVSTTRDLDRFTKSLLSGKLTSRASLAQMLTPRSDAGYGLGVFAIPDPCTPAGAPQQYLVGHNGASFGTFSFAMSSTDGTRQFSMGITGRHFKSLEQPYDMYGLVARIAAETCT